MMTEQDIEYLEWLTLQIACEYEKYRGLFNLLHEREFVWVVPNDDNRVADALELRREFFDTYPPYRDLNRGASVLEVIVALSRRVAYNGGGEAEEWAWTLIENLGLDKMRDPLSRRQKEKIEEILFTLIWRTYEHNGVGGFFPLENSNEDQRNIEIWYQMSAYILERDLV